jgi:hypothetical protein
VGQGYEGHSKYNLKEKETVDDPKQNGSARY